MTFSITRQDIEREGCLRHRVVVRKMVNGKNIIWDIVEAHNPEYAYKQARKRAGIRGKVPVEVLPKHVETWLEMHH